MEKSTKNTAAYSRVFLQQTSINHNFKHETKIQWHRGKISAILEKNNYLAVLSLGNEI